MAGDEVKLTVQIVDPLNRERFTTHQLVSLDSAKETASETAERMVQAFRKERKAMCRTVKLK